jgi:hypothetical protein
LGSGLKREAYGGEEWTFICFETPVSPGVATIRARLG